MTVVDVLETCGEPDRRVPWVAAADGQCMVYRPAAPKPAAWVVCVRPDKHAVPNGRSETVLMVRRVFALKNAEAVTTIAGIDGLGGP